MGQWGVGLLSCLQQFYRLGMNKSLRQGGSRSQAKFILIHGQTKQEEPIKWHWLTQKSAPAQEDALMAAIPPLSYSQKKSLLSDLHRKQRAVSSFKIREGFSRKQKVRVISTAATVGKTERRSMQPFLYLNASEQQMAIPNINLPAIKQELVTRMVDAQMANRAIIAVLAARRTGLRYKLYHSFAEWCPCGKSSHGHELASLGEQVRRQIKDFSRIQRELYFFFPDGSPVHSFTDIEKRKPAVLLVDCAPRLNFSQEVLNRIGEQAHKIQLVFNLSSKIREKERNSKEEGYHDGDDQEIYDWQRIPNVKQYVDMISQDPHQNMLQPKTERKSELSNWYNERYTADLSQSSRPSKQTHRNPLFQSKSHFPQEIINKKLLSAAGQKLQALETTNNRHKFIPARLDLMMESVRRESSNQASPKQAKSSPKERVLSKRDLLQNLDRKNTLLSTQNIPYLIQKYGLNRFQVYNLYNLYKSFQKVSLLRHPKMEAVLAHGIDRQSFQAGLKGLDMNPGDELIRNICYFGDFISWQQFIKIISISLRKTPEEKLTAILKGISSAQDGFLTRHQISLMIGNSLQKLFDRQEPELREYFTDMAMREFEEKDGKVMIEVLKRKVLDRGEDNLTMVSFLILNT